MRIVSCKALSEFAKIHSKCEASCAGKVVQFTVFNVGGNMARIIAVIHYNLDRRWKLD
jgi:mRNA-degrading endonuclease HigB of HigAB toxin-antitoxin module